VETFNLFSFSVVSVLSHFQLFNEQIDTWVTLLDTSIYSSYNFDSTEDSPETVWVNIQSTTRSFLATTIGALCCWIMTS